MIVARPVPSVDDDELLARFIVNQNEFRPGDNTVKPKLFLPYRYVDLSVNRHRDSDTEELWQVGAAVAQSRKRSLYGRADIKAGTCRIGSLDVLQKPHFPENPNHADITGFPAAKEDQMSLAQKLADSARHRIPPPGG